MSDLDSYELNERSPGDPDMGDEEPPTEGEDVAGRRRVLIAIAACVLLVVVAGWWWWSRRDVAPEIAASPEQAAQAVVEPELEPEEEPSEPFAVPELDASDVVVRELAAALSANPEFAAWLINEDLVRRFVVAVDNIAEGQTPRAHLGFMAPKSGFRTWEAEGKLHISPTSFRRYDPVTEAFVSIDTKGAIGLFRRLEPLAQEAYRELGYPQQSFEDAVRRAAGMVLETPLTDGPIELEAAVRSYRFADPGLEALDPVQKQLLRFGPRNLEKIQTKVRALLQELDADS